MAENRRDMAENLKKLDFAELVEPAFSNSALGQGVLVNIQC